MRAILYNNGVEVRRGNYPDLEIKLIPLPAGYEWKLIFEQPRPTLTPIQNLVREEQDNDNSHPDYPHLKMIEVVYTVVKKSDAEIIALLEAREDNANQSLMSHTDRLKIMVLYMAIVNRKVNGDPINAKMQAILDKVDARALKLWQNDTNLENKLNELSQGGNPNIDDGWQS